MLEFNYTNFKEAIKKIEQEKHAELRKEIDQVKAFVEKVLTMSLDSCANRARTSYPGIEL